MRLDKRKLKALVEDHCLENEFPSVAAKSPRTPFQGLEICQGLRCLHCSKVLGTHNSMQKHHQEEHAANHPTPKEWPACFMQRLSSRAGPCRQYFEVKQPPTQQEATLEAMMEDLRVNTTNTIRVNMAAPNARSISPWLLATGWHTHILGYEIGELINLRSIPKDEEFPGLKALVKSYMLMAIDLMDSTDNLCLQYLNTDDPAKT